MLTHHAYYIEGPIAQTNEYAEHIRKSEGFVPHDPNFSIRNFDQMGIEDARSLISIASLKNTGARALFIISVASITTEAQQALLKLFEEPQVGTIFILLVPPGMLLPTLRSRFLAYPDKLPAQKGTGEAKEFLTWPYKKRSDWITALLKEDEDSRERVRIFLNELEEELHTKITESRDVRESLFEIAHFRQYLSDRSPSLKMILEHFAATLPLYK